MDYAKKAREIVASQSGIAEEDEFYVVWFCKTLQNWKALVSTDVIHGVYWEVTHNGIAKETYVDTYHKQSNVAVPDALS